MYVSSRLLSGRVLAVAFAVGLWGLAIPFSQAEVRPQTCAADLHAQHEAREACDRSDDAYARALREVQEARERLSDKLAKAKALEGDICYACEPVAEAQPKSESDLNRSKPASELQYVGTPVNIFGLTVADIYDQGIIVTDVDLGSTAGQLGIRRGDVILAVNGAPVLNTDDFQKFIHQLVGNTVILTVSRYGHANLFMMEAH